MHISASTAPIRVKQKPLHSQLNAECDKHCYNNLFKYLENPPESLPMYCEYFQEKQKLCFWYLSVDVLSRKGCTGKSKFNNILILQIEVKTLSRQNNSRRNWSRRTRHVIGGRGLHDNFDTRYMHANCISFSNLPRSHLLKHYLLCTTNQQWPQGCNKCNDYKMITVVKHKIYL